MKKDRETKNQNDGSFKGRIQLWIWSIMWLLMGFCITVLILKQ